VSIKFSKVFIVISFILFLGGGVQLLDTIRGVNVNITSLTGDLISQIIYSSIYLFTFILLVFSERKISVRIIQNFWFWLLLAWTCGSVVWSGSPAITIRQVAAIFGTTLFSFYVANTLDIQEYLKLLGISLLIINISSYLVIIFFPSIGVTHVVSDEWAGIFSNKNLLGKAASLSLLLFFYLALTIKRRKLIWLAGTISAIGLLLGSQSATAIIVSIYIILVLLLIYVGKKNFKLLWPFFVGIIIIVLLIPLPSVNQILSYFGKDETLSGRTLIWNFSINMALRKPMLGYGYGAFWLGWDGPSAGLLKELNGWGPTHSHNGFIDIILDIGVIGFIFFIFAYWSVFKKSAKYFLNGKFGFKYSIFFIFLIWILPYNITEQALLAQNSIFWIIFSSVIFYLSNMYSTMQ
jgi:exopolysaccharide production protein ExoQ